MVSLKNILYLQNLIAIAAADGAICERELVYLRKKAYGFNLTEESLLKMVENSREFTIITPFEEDTKLKYLSDCVDMALADGIITATEMVKCRSVCAMMNLSESHLHNLIAMKKITVL